MAIIWLFTKHLERLAEQTAFNLTRSVTPIFILAATCMPLFFLWNSDKHFNCNSRSAVETDIIVA